MSSKQFEESNQFEEREDSGIQLILQRIQKLQEKVHKMVDDLKKRRGCD